MRTARSILVMALLGVGLAAPAHAAKRLNTAPALDYFSGGEKLYCNVVNTGQSTVKVTIQMRYDNGMLQAQTSTSLEPASYDVLSVANSVSAYCRFIVHGSAKGIRAAGLYIDPQTGHRMVTVPAR